MRAPVIALIVRSILIAAVVFANIGSVCRADEPSALITNLDPLDPDAMDCTTMLEIDKCDAMIASGNYAGRALSEIFVGRGAGGEMHAGAAGPGPREDYTKAIETDATNAEAYLRRGTYLAEHDARFEAAASDLKKALELGQKRASSALGFAYCAMGNFDLGLDQLNTALILDPKSGASYERRGQCFEKQGVNDKAEADYKSALDLTKDEVTKARLQIRIATVSTAKARAQLSQIGKMETPAVAGGAATKQAEAEAVRIAKSSPLHDGQGTDLGSPAVPESLPSVHAGVYRVYGRNPNGSTYRAMAALSQTAGGFKVTSWNDANVFWGVGKLDGGKLQLVYSSGARAILELSSDGSMSGALSGSIGNGGSEYYEPYGYVGPLAMMIAEGDYRLAGRDSNGVPSGGSVKIIKQGRGYHLAWQYDDGFAMEANGTLADNLLLLDSNTNRTWPKDAAVVYALAEDGSLSGLFASGAGLERLTPATSAAAAASNVPVVKWRDPEAEGKLCVSMHEPGTIAHCNRALNVLGFSAADRVTLFNRRGSLFFVHNDGAAAMSDFASALSIDPHNAIALANRGHVLLRIGNYDGAIETLNSAIAADPNNADAYKVRAQAREQKGETGVARDDYNKALSLNPADEDKKEIEQALIRMGPDFRSMRAQ